MSITQSNSDDIFNTKLAQYKLFGFDLEQRLAELSPENREKYKTSLMDPNGLNSQLSAFRAECRQQIELIKSYNGGKIPPLMFNGKNFSKEL